MQENGSGSFVAIQFKLCRKTNFHIFEKCYDQRFPNFANWFALKEIAFSSVFSSEEKTKLKKIPKYCKGLS